ncbi:hypothetical protein AUR64_13245 [Haloprofundus marisrubri]|uniref:Uncharacterized protein n=1 Tax=Haloprofundus marisrubri TaxID=1514971 RepID=A0A0W1R5S7_9EURY|nr:hypothetical protein [Haloprofundus marisrubri]KTG08787.1 hypothetical protein AUR64_13245 [Haloprofundus marisrubri]
MVETAVTSPYSTVRYSLQFLPHALVFALGSTAVGIAVGSVFADLFGAWFPILGGIPQLAFFFGGVVVCVLSTVGIAAELLGEVGE